LNVLENSDLTCRKGYDFFNKINATNSFNQVKFIVDKYNKAVDNGDNFDDFIKSIDDIPKITDSKSFIRNFIIFMTCEPMKYKINNPFVKKID
jgi:hypothetical protein